MKDKGDQIILMGDIKEYISSHNIIGFMANLGLTEIVTNKHVGKRLATTGSKNKVQAINGI